jgi:hypothetical protein
MPASTGERGSSVVLVNRSAVSYEYDMELCAIAADDRERSDDVVHV